ncbi:T9SS type A sorting domain-containing protein, partial [Maribellus maritimus]|uniref:T9SS type A sorting domain-containing protein n=1 Tax=Maribellus maritimus TaxID=2870838 RepID=UPI001EECF2BC
TATDNCDADVDVSFKEVYSDTICDNSYTITRKWTATDNCGNQTFHSQVVTIQDTTPPTFTSPDDITIYSDTICEYDSSVTQTGDVTDESDNCSTTELEATFTDKTEAGESPGEWVITRIWSLSDDCGNKAKEQIQIITVKDSITPSIIWTPVEIFLNEKGEYKLTDEDIAALTEKITDNCTPSENIEIELSPKSFNCSNTGEKTEMQIVAIDLNGNRSKIRETITVSDTISPTINEVEDISIVLKNNPCDTFVSIKYPEISFRDNCSATLKQITGLGSRESFPVGSTTETWVATDKSGNTDTLSFNVIIIPGNASPTIAPITDLTINEDQEPVSLNLSGISSGNDCLTQELSISVTSSNNTLTDSLLIDYTQGAPTAILKIVPAPNMNGETKITVTIEDSEGGTTSKTFTVTIEAVNDAPYKITSIPDQIIHASSILKIPVSPFTGHLFGDIEDEILTINITSEGNNSLPTWATLTGDMIVCTPSIADTGCVNIIAKASDAEGAFVTDTFQVCVDGFPVGINSAENKEFEIKMYPNPTSGEVTIKFSSKISNAELIITDITGKTVFNGQVNAEQEIMLNLSDNVSGIYFVRLIMDKKQIVKKLILKTNKHAR